MISPRLALFVPFYQLLNNKLGRIITMPLKFRYTKATGSWLSIITLVAYVLTKVSVTAFTGGIFFEYLLGHTLLVWCFGTDFHHRSLYHLRRNEGRDDDVCHSNSYSDHRFLPGTFPRRLTVGRRKHHPGLEQYDDLLQSSAQWLRHHTCSTGARVIPCTMSIPDSLSSSERLSLDSGTGAPTSTSAACTLVEDQGRGQ